VIPVDYSDKESIKYALAGIDVVVSTLPDVALGLQPGIAEAAKEACEVVCPIRIRGTDRG